MDIPHNHEIIGGGCPVVLLAGDLEMQARQTEALYSALSEEQKSVRPIGFTEVDGDMVQLNSVDGRLFSVRGFQEIDETKLPRVVRPVAVGKIGIEGEYLVNPDVELPEGTTLDRILNGNIGIQTHPGSQDAGISVYLNHLEEVPFSSRTGLLSLKRDGVDMPIARTIDGRTYVVEVKGCGNAAGQLVVQEDKFYNDIVFGALPWTDAVREYHNLKRANEAALTPVIPLALGRVALPEGSSESIGDMGIVFRLTPSTLRLSHRGFAGEVPLDSPEDSLVVVTKLVDNFLDKFFRPEDVPVFLSPASHLENYLVTDGLTFTETDFEDFRDFGSTEIPFVHSQTGRFIDTQKIIQHYFTNMGRVIGFDQENQVEVVADFIKRRLSTKDVEVTFDEAKTLEDIACGLWRQWIIFLEHEDHLEKGYMPDAILDTFVANHNRAQEIASKMDSGVSLSKEEAKEYENRVIKGLTYFKEFIDSEAEKYQVLTDKEISGLDVLGRVLTWADKSWRTLDESRSPEGCLRFFFIEMPNLLDAIDLSYRATYPGRVSQ